MAADELYRETRDGVATLTLNRPKQRNALSKSLMLSIQAALTDIAGDESVGVVILRANGPGFCAGHDLREMRSLAGEDDLREVFEVCSRMMMSIVELPQPVVARVHGIATAAGCQLVASCDLAVASHDARFATPGVNLGLFCSTPMVALSRNVHTKHAMEMLLTGEMVSAERAVATGLVNSAVPAAELDGEVDRLVNKILGKSRTAIRIGKRAFYRQRELDLHAAYEYTGAIMARNMLEDDAVEGIDAFIEKRAPAWARG